MSEDCMNSPRASASRDLETLTGIFMRVWPVDESPCFGELVHAIDEAERDAGSNSNEDGERD